MGRARREAAICWPSFTQKHVLRWLIGALNGEGVGTSAIMVPTTARRGMFTPTKGASGVDVQNRVPAQWVLAATRPRLLCNQLTGHGSRIVISIDGPWPAVQGHGRAAIHGLGWRLLSRSSIPCSDGPMRVITCLACVRPGPRTTPCVRCSLPRPNATRWTAGCSKPGPGRASPAARSSKAGTSPLGAIQPSPTNHARINRRALDATVGAVDG